MEDYKYSIIEFLKYLSIAPNNILENDSFTCLARQRVFRDHLNPIDKYNDVQFLKRFRVTKGIVFFQLEEKL